MKKLIVLFALFAVAAFAADLTGTWAGNLDLTIDGDQQSSTAKIVLKQDGEKVTGTAGREDEGQAPIQNATVDGDTLSFDIKPADEAPLIHIVLKLDGDSLTGTAKSVGEGPAIEGKLDLKREK